MIRKCMFCGHESYMVGLLQVTTHNETYCPFCMHTQEEAMVCIFFLGLENGK